MDPLCSCRGVTLPEPVKFGMVVGMPLKLPIGFLPLAAGS
jgi:hypothetical protein